MEKYLLKNKNVVAAVFRQVTALNQVFFELEYRTDAYLPYGFTTAEEWLRHRPAAKHQRHIQEYMKKCGIADTKGLADLTHCVSLTDTFWVAPESSTLTWEQVSPYQNNFNEVVARLAFDGAGMYGERFSGTSPELTTDGASLKCWVRDSNEIFLIKRGMDGFASNSGWEPHSEQLSSQVLRYLSYEHVPYSLLRYRGHIASSCPLFTSERLGYVNMASFLTEKGLPHNALGVLEAIKATGTQEAFYRMLLADAIILNVDRHMGNYGFLVDNESGQVESFAPLFDHNMAMLPYYTKDRDLTEYIAAQSPHPSLGGSFDSMAEYALDRCPGLKSDLIRLSSFELSSPGYDYPEWRVIAMNKAIRTQASVCLSSSSSQVNVFPEMNMSQSEHVEQEDSLEDLDDIDR